MLRFALNDFMDKENLSIQDVANKTGISRPTISQFYNNKGKGIQFETLDKIVRGLDIDVIDDLFRDEIFNKDLEISVEVTTSLDLDDVLDDGYEPVLTVHFYSPEDSVDYFRMPITTKLGKSSSSSIDTIIFSYSYAFSGPEAVSSRMLYKLNMYLLNQDKKNLESLFGKISSQCLEQLTFRDSNLKNSFKNIIFRANTGGHEWFYIYSWPVYLMKNIDSFNHFIKLKYC